MCENITEHIEVCTIITDNTSREKEIDEKEKFDINPEISQSERDKLLDILYKNRDVFAQPNDTLEGTDVVQHSIHTGTHPPIRQRLWNRYSHEENAIIAQQLQEMVDQGIIRRAYSPWATNIVLARKADGKHRICADYRALNKVQVHDSFPIPKISDVIESLAGSKYFSPLDLQWGFWQIRMNTEDGSDLKTAIITKQGTFAFNRMPFGLKCAPLEFMRLVDKGFDDMKDELG